MSHDSAPPPLPAKVDLVVVGAGIVGLAHAVEAHARGHSVLVLDGAARPDGSTARRSGHVAVTTQDSTALACALASRERWLKLGRDAGFGVRESGAVVVAQHADELAVLDDLVAARAGDAELLDHRSVADRTPVAHAVGGVWLPLDLRLDPYAALLAICDWLSSRPQVDVAWRTAAQTFDAGSGCTLVRTSRGEVVAKRVVVAAGQAVGSLFWSAGADLTPVRRQLLRVAPPTPDDVAAQARLASGPVVLGGTTVLRDAAYLHSRALGEVRDRWRRHRPDLLAAEIHLSLHSQADGSVVVGDGRAPADVPGRSEAVDGLLLDATAELLGTGPLTVLGRWTATEPVRARTAPVADPFVVTEPLPGVRTVNVTDGLATTTALGLAPRVLDELF
ncbi:MULTISPECIES: FAD-dependent oxidoreductase [Isoptericola]|uniref:FAD-dependent oxidoreductase n=1 Tax=Isoptericola haloaureus TaxID=1542902 RepID=A0ABU7ZAA7_9MICO|nr:FAD-dependent oxidoreductase [Isoptericola sp. AK164]